MGAILAHQGLLMAQTVVAGATVLNSADKSSTITLSGGDLTATKASGGLGHVLVRATNGKATGLWYWEVVITAAMANSREVAALTKSSVATNVQPGGVANGIGYNGINGILYNQGGGGGFGATYDTGDVIGIALNMTTGKVWFAKNNTWQASGNPAADTNPAVSGLSGTWYPTIGLFDQGGAAAIRFQSAGQTYSPPAGFTAYG